MAAGKMKINFP